MKVPPCLTCGRPLGLYYAECNTCLDHANDFSFSDYEETVLRPGGEDA